MKHTFMKQILSLVLCAALVLITLVACGPNADNPTDTTQTESTGGTNQTESTAEETPTTTGSPTETTPETDPTTTPVSPYEAVDPADLTPTKTYDNDYGALLSVYADRTVEDYEGVCAHYEQAGFDLYCENAINGNLFSTYTKESRLAHVYWIDSDQDLKIVTSETEGDSLPPQEIDATGTKVTSVRQLQQKSDDWSGLSYIIELSDGSFIIYDGGYSTTVNQLLDELKSLDEDGNVHVRAWVMTHAHDDHYGCFKTLAGRKGYFLSRHDLTMQLDYFLMAPINDQDTVNIDAGLDFYMNDVETCVQKFDGAKICYAHTGMTFRFGNMTMEILYTPEDLFVDGSTGYFNDSSIVSRLYSNRPESGETQSMIFLGDAGMDVANRLVQYYGDALYSDMCQISHHGVENFPLSAYEVIAAPTLFYPCNNELYARTDRDADVRAALRNSEVTKEILLRDNDKYVRYFDPSLNPAPIGKPDATGKLEGEA